MAVATKNEFFSFMVSIYFYLIVFHKPIVCAFFSSCFDNSDQKKCPNPNFKSVLSVFSKTLVDEQWTRCPIVTFVISSQ